MTRPLNVALAGLGTVGAGVLQMLRQNADLITARAGRPIAVTAVSARDRTRDRGFSLAGLRWFDDPVALAFDPTVDVVVEVIGGAEGPARAVVEAAIAAHKPVVTANKALLAVHGATLAGAAEAADVPLAFEAAVAGGIPVIKALREGLAGNRISRVAGILNGTCNYILTEMEASGRPFADVLAEAQRLGYAEADPTMDVGGFDAAHKISILAALAFGCAPTYAAAEIEGIDAIEPIDIRLAKDLGYRIKLVASAVRSAEGVSVTVHPALAPLSHPLAQTGGALNALFIQGRTIGRIFIQGPGAGSGPTAAAVAADIADVMTGARRPVFQAPASTLKPFARVDARLAVGRAYVRLLVRDEPGVIAAVTEALAEAGVSIDSFLQKPVEDAGGVPIVLTTHVAPEEVILGAVRRIASLSALIESPRMIRIARI